MPKSPLALRMMAAKYAQLARAMADATEAERFMAQARRCERLAVELERSQKPLRHTAPAERAKTRS